MRRTICALATLASLATWNAQARAGAVVYDTIPECRQFQSHQND